MRYLAPLAGLLIAAANVAAAAEPIVIADFEGTDYGQWQATGTAFGAVPAQGTLPGQMHVDGFAGRGLINSFAGGDAAVGRLTSPPVTIERRFITFLIGGGGWVDETCLNLMIDGKVLRTATGPNVVDGGSERPAAWDVGDLVGRTATIVIIDERHDGWGHINIDQIVQTDDRGAIPLAAAPAPIARNATREVRVEKRLLHFPIKNGAKKRVVTVAAGGDVVRRFDIELADNQAEDQANNHADGGADWWAPLDVSPWTGQRLTIVVDALPEGSQALDALRQSDTLEGAEQLYREALRPQLHFSARRGWLNDPNGLVYYNGEYHLFFQHNPYGWGWGNMHWGHATSADLVHWQEHGDVLAPDALGPMFSGSAVVDWHNTSGLGQDGRPPLVLIYTAAGNPTVQCLAHSTDGRQFTKFGGNPVVRQITPGNRDPKVCWHEPTKQWVMVLYVEREKVHTVEFLTSPNLRDWTPAGVAAGGAANDHYLYECPDFFALPVDGDAARRKWLLTAADSRYALGGFDGRTFTPETARLPGVQGVGFYAAQTFSDLADGRRVQIGWCQAPSPGMPFNQLQSLPSELSLRSTPEGVRLCRTPVHELAALRAGPNQAAALAGFRGELVELRAEFTPGKAERVTFTVRGAKIEYDSKRQEIVVQGHRAAAPLVDGRQRLVVYVDRTMLEVFASDGLTYVPLPFIPEPAEQSVALDLDGAEPSRLEVYRLESIWPDQAPAVK